jgi:spoIIIJ-associated protein
MPENDYNQVLETTRDLLEKAGFQADVRLVEGGLGGSFLPVVSIESEKDLSILIGKNGQNLNALEHIVKIIALRKAGINENRSAGNFAVDINDYRKSRSHYILEVARSVAQRVIGSQKAEALTPMNPYERRLVHTELASYKEIQTESIGEEPHRRIVIKPLILE